MGDSYRQIPKGVTMTPLWVISLFVSLTEVVTGVAVTQAKEGVQVALTVFVIAFPLLVAGAFFFILWSRPFVFYPPGEFSEKIKVSEFVDAMSRGISRDSTTKDVPPDQVDDIVAGYQLDNPKSIEKIQQPDGYWTVVATWPNDDSDESSSKR